MDIATLYGQAFAFPYREFSSILEEIPTDYLLFIYKELDTLEEQLQPIENLQWN